MMNYKLLCAAALITTACNNDNYHYDASYAESVAKTAFEENFKNAFGTIDSDQSWDLGESPLSSIVAAENNVKEQTRATRAAGTNVVTKEADANYPYNTDGWYELPANTYTTLDKIKESSDNTKIGYTFAMTTPANSFSIIPIRQGYTSSSWELHMVVGTGDDATDYLICKKGEDYLQYKSSESGAWTELGTSQSAVSYGKYAVRCKAYTFEETAGQPIYFYVYRPSAKTYPSSLEGYTRDFTSVIDLPQQLVDDQKEIRVIGFEAQYGNSDRDFEDVMFMIVGNPELPEDIDIANDTKIQFKQTISKRYMIEDLGDTDDTDYNDIVVDITAERLIRSIKTDESGAITEQTYGPWYNEKATIRHLGGTLPFQLTLGNTTLKEMEGQMGANPNTTFSITGWDPDANNISISVKQNSGEGTNSITFPTTGSVPLIIATSTSQAWMTERQSIIDTLKQLIINKKSN